MKKAKKMEIKRARTHTLNRMCECYKRILNQERDRQWRRRRHRRRHSRHWSAENVCINKCVFNSIWEKGTKKKVVVFLAAAKATIQQNQIEEAIKKCYEK